MKYIRWNLEKAQAVFEERGCKLIEEEYVNYSTPMRYIASCGHEHKISLNNFVQGKGTLCRACKFKAAAAHERRLQTDIVRSALEDECCELITDSVPTWRTRFKYVAQCGHESEIDFSHWTSGGGRLCSACSKSIRYTQGYVESVFKLYGCELLDDYVNCKTPIAYKDPYGKVRHTTFDIFVNGRNKRDRDAGLPPWRLFVFSRDDYTCQVCGERGGDLEAHHLESYADNVEDRLDPENGVTLCQACHRAFHKAKGFGNNTRIQFDEWKREYRGNCEPNNSQHRNA